MAQNMVQDINPNLLSAFEAKNPRKATKIIATPVKISTCGKNSGSDS